MRNRAALVQGAMALAALASATTSASDSAVARDYSLRMLAHVPTRCMVRQSTRDVHFADQQVGEAIPLRADGGFSISCNVPYAVGFQRVTRRLGRGRLLPVAAFDGVDSPYDLAVKLPGSDGEIAGRCDAAELSSDAPACMPVSGPDDPRSAAPRALVRIALSRNTANSSDAPVALAHAVTSGGLSAGPRPYRAALRVVVTGRH